MNKLIMSLVGRTSSSSTTTSPSETTRENLLIDHVAPLPAGENVLNDPTSTSSTGQDSPLVVSTTTQIERQDSSGDDQSWNIIEMDDNQDKTALPARLEEYKQKMRFLQKQVDELNEKLEIKELMIRKDTLVVKGLPSRFGLLNIQTDRLDKNKCNHQARKLIKCLVDQDVEYIDAFRMNNLLFVRLPSRKLQTDILVNSRTQKGIVRDPCTGQDHKIIINRSMPKEHGHWAYEVREAVRQIKATDPSARIKKREYVLIVNGRQLIFEWTEKAKRLYPWQFKNIDQLIGATLEAPQINELLDI